MHGSTGGCWKRSCWGQTQVCRASGHRASARPYDLVNWLPDHDNLGWTRYSVHSAASFGKCQNGRDTRKPVAGIMDGGMPMVRRYVKTPCTMSVSYTHLRAHETDSYLVCRL